MIAEFSKSQNDLFWKYRLPTGEIIRWSGYDDTNWWNNVSETDRFRNKQDSNGNIYRLDPNTDEVTAI